MATFVVVCVAVCGPGKADTLSPTRERGERDGRQNLSTPFGDAETLAEGVEDYANGPRETESNCEVRGCELSLLSGRPGLFFCVMCVPSD